MSVGTLFAALVAILGAVSGVIKILEWLDVKPTDLKARVTGHLRQLARRRLWCCVGCRNLVSCGSPFTTEVRDANWTHSEYNWPGGALPYVHIEFWVFVPPSRPGKVTWAGIDVIGEGLPCKLTAGVTSDGRFVLFEVDRNSPEFTEPGYAAPGQWHKIALTRNHVGYVVEIDGLAPFGYHEIVLKDGSKAWPPKAVIRYRAWGEHEFPLALFGPAPKRSR